MLEEIINSDLAKEALMVLSFWKEDMIAKVDDQFLQRLSDIAADSHKEFYFDKNKPLDEQNISNDCRDLITMVYYCYIANNQEQREVFNSWINNSKRSN